MFGDSAAFVEIFKRSEERKSVKRSLLSNEKWWRLSFRKKEEKKFHNRGEVSEEGDAEFFNWANPGLFLFILVLFKRHFAEKLHRLQRDSTSARRSRRQARWPFDHHHGPKGRTPVTHFIEEAKSNTSTKY